MTKLFDWDESESFDWIDIDWNAMRNALNMGRQSEDSSDLIINPIEGQTSMFSRFENFNNKEEINNFSSFEDIVYKNPAYTVQELLDLHHLALEGMSDEY